MYNNYSIQQIQEKEEKEEKERKEREKEKEEKGKEKEKENSDITAASHSQITEIHPTKINVKSGKNVYITYIKSVSTPTEASLSAPVQEHPPISSLPPAEQPQLSSPTEASPSAPVQEQPQITSSPQLSATTKEPSTSSHPNSRKPV